MSERQDVASAFHEQVAAYKTALETETVHELLVLHGTLSRSMGRFSNALLVVAAILAAAGIFSYPTLVDVIGYGGALACFAVLTLAALAGLVSKDFGQRVEMMLAGLVPVSSIAETLAARHPERVRMLEQLGERSGAPVKPAELAPDPNVIEAALTYPDSLLTRWAFGVVRSDDDGATESQIMSNIAYQTIAQKLQLGCLVLLFVVVTAALLYRHGYEVGGSDQRTEACFAAHVQSVTGVRELGHAGI